jgi:hypothetical protein
MVQAALQGLPAGRLERNGVGSADEHDRAMGGVDVDDLQLPQLGRGRGVQEGEEAREALVGVGTGISAPAAKEAALFFQAEGAAPEPANPPAGHPGGRIGEHHPLRPRPAEELTEHAALARSTERLAGEERLQVASVHRGPVGLGPLGDEKTGKIPHDREVVDDGAIAARTSGRSTRPLLSGDEGVRVAGHRRAQRLGRLLHPPLASPCGETCRVVERERKVCIDEELLQGARERPHRAARLAGPRQQCLGRRRRCPYEEPAEVTDHE